jgi:hypothetical protein
MGCITSTSTQFDSADTVRTYMEEARTTIQNMVELHSRDTGAENFWLNFVKAETFELGKGFRQKKKIREQSYIPPDAQWRNMHDVVTSGDGKACTICPIKLKFGSNFREFDLEALEVRGPDICYLELLQLEEFRAELDHQYRELTRARRILYSNRYRDAYIGMAGRKYIMQADLPWTGTEDSFPDPTGAQVGLPHEDILRHIAAAFDAAGGYVPGQNAGMVGNAPIYWAIGRHEVSDTIMRSDGDARQDIRDSSMADELLRVTHNSVVYKRFRFIEDAEAPRFNYNTTTDEWERVNYYREVPASIGVVAEENPDYETAQYDCMLFVANQLGPRCQKLPQAVSVGGNTGMGTAHTDFNFVLKDYPDLESNIMGWNGFFLGTALEAIDPGQSRFVIAVMFARNVGGVTINAPTVTTPGTATDRPLSAKSERPCCAILPTSSCANAAEFTCASTTAAGYTNGIELEPITEGEVVAGSDYEIAGADGVTFRAVEVDGHRVVFGYEGDPIACTDLVKEWTVTPA